MPLKQSVPFEELLLEDELLELELDDELLDEELLELDEVLLDEEHGGRPCGFAPWPFQQPGSNAGRCNGAATDWALAWPARFSATTRTRQNVTP